MTNNNFILFIIYMFLSFVFDLIWQGTKEWLSRLFRLLYFIAFLSYVYNHGNYFYGNLPVFYGFLAMLVLVSIFYFLKKE